MIKLTKDGLYLLIIAVLVIVILLQRSCSGPPHTGAGLPLKPEVLHDTVYKEVTVTQTKKVPFIKRDTTYLPGDTVFVPSDNHNELKKQFELMARNYGARNIHRDSVSVDTYGYLVVTDTVQYNKLQNRTYLHNYKLPVVTSTVLPKPRRQLYIGGGISINNELSLSNVNAGFLYKNRQDQIYGLYTGIDAEMRPFVGLSAYWKISFKK